MVHFWQVQKDLRRTGESKTVEEGFNHTELVTLVSEGIQKSMAEKEMKQAKSANMLQVNGDLQQQVKKMQHMIA